MKRRIVWMNLGLALLLVAAAAVTYFAVFAPKEAVATTGRTVAVQQGTVTETVTATGTVETSGTVQLSFAANGTISSVEVTQGQEVEAGAVLATLDDTSAQQALASAKSSLVQARNGQKQGTVSVAQATASVTQSEQTLADARVNARLNSTSYQQAVDTAKSNLADARSTWSNSCLDPAGTCPDASAWTQLRAAEADVASAKTAYTQAVQNATNDETTNNLKVSQAQTAVTLATGKQSTDCAVYGASSKECSTANDNVITAQQQLTLAQNSQRIAATQSEQSLVNADARITQANIALKKLQSSLAQASQNSVTNAQEALDSATLNQRKGLAADQQSIEKAQQTLRNAELSAQAVAVGSGSTSTTQAQLDVARASVASAQEAVDQTALTAPVAGTIASVDIDPGQSAQAGTAAVTLIPDAPYEVVASFSEADALKLEVDQTAAVTFDALPEATAKGTVTSIDIIPTTGNNVTTYGVTITLADTSESLKDGMSASVVVTTGEATDVLWAPTAAITTAGGQSTVTVRTNGVDATVPVTTGLAGDTGTEITDGVTEGQQLVISTSDSSGASGFPMGGIPGGLSGGTPPAGGPPTGIGG